MRQPKITSIHDQQPNFMGGNRQIILSSQETAGDIYLVKGIMPKGSSVPVHIHQQEDEIFHVLEGEVQLTLGEEELSGKAGDVIYLPRGIKHAIKTVGEETAIVLNYVVPGKNFEAFFEEMKTLGDEPDPSEVAAVAQKYDITFL